MRAEQTKPDEGFSSVTEQRRGVWIKIKMPPIDPELQKLISDFQRNQIMNSFHTKSFDTNNWWK